MTDVKPDMATVLEHYGFDLPHHRGQFGVKVKCVFHGDKQASAVFNESRQYYACFACDRRGDSWQLLMDEEGLTFPEAKTFAEDQGWLDSAPAPSSPTERAPRRSRTRIKRRRRV